MPSFTYDPTIPVGTHFPGNDRPLMQQNFNSTQGILNVDHYSFDDSVNGGWHKQVVLPASNVPGSSPIGTSSVIYSGDGQATVPGISELYFRNPLATFLLNSIKAFGLISLSGSAGSQTILNQYNVSSASYDVPTHRLTVVLTSNIVSGNNALIMAFGPNTGQINLLSFNNPTAVFTIGDFNVGDKFNLIVLQA